jgi:flagellar hook assembly protein FlgD
VQPSSVQFEYTVLGELQPTDSGEEQDVAATGVGFSVENPVRREATLFVSVPRDMVTGLRIYSVAGAHVATLHEGNLEIGTHQIRWNGRNDRGAPMPSGLYLARLETPSRTLTRKLLMLQ